MNWHTSAACRTHPSDLFFDDDRQHEARAVCARCPVTRDCLAAAIERGEEYGIWGGLNARQRASAANRRAVGMLEICRPVPARAARAVAIYRDALTHSVDPVEAITLRMLLVSRTEALALLDEARAAGLTVPEVSSVP